MAAGDIFMASDSACVRTPSGEVFIVAGKTTVRAGHPLHKSHPHLFKLLKVDFDVEPAPPPPPEPVKAAPKAEERKAEDAPTPTKSARADQVGARARAGS